MPYILFVSLKRTFLLIFVSGAALFSFFQWNSFTSGADGVLSVVLSALPNSGQAPLNNVSLTAQVSGTARGNVRYNFDCTSDGVVDESFLTSSETITAENLCNYFDPGTFFARVEAEREGLFAIAQIQISVSAPAVNPPPADPPTLSASLAALPNSGQAPLNNVSLTAQVSGTARGNVRYNFDCTSDGVVDESFLTSSELITAESICNYPNSGTFFARVEAEREGLFAIAQTAITVSAVLPPPPPPPPVLPTLAATLSASPASGQPPLDSVSLTVQISGTARGNIRYFFDCQSDNVVDETFLTSSEIITAENLCNYPSAGVFVAEVEAEREGLFFIATTSINVSTTPPAPPPPPPSGGGGGGGGGGGSFPLALYVTLSSNVASGSAPLAVSLTARTSGVSGGISQFSFDCNLDDTIEHRNLEVLSDTYTAPDVCIYALPGVYTAKVRAEKSGVTAFDSVRITVFPAQPTLGVSLTAIPASGFAPLRNVSLLAKVSGNMRGPIVYKFFCEDLILPQRTLTFSSETAVADKLCAFAEAGDHSAFVQVERAGKTATATALIRANRPQAVPALGFRLNKAVRNKTQNETVWQESIEALPSDELEFRIIVSAGDSEIQNAFLSDAPDERLILIGDLRINGVLSLDRNIVSGFVLPSISAGSQAAINFSARLADLSNFPAPSTKITNIVVVSAAQETRTDSVAISVAGREEEVLPPGAVEGATASKEAGELTGFLASVADLWPFRSPISLIIFAIWALAVIFFLVRRRTKTASEK